MTIRICEKDQLENAIFKTNQFLKEYSKNYNSVIKSIICKKPLSFSMIEEFYRCSFESYLKFLKKIDSNSDYSFLEEKHKNFHIFLNEVLELYIKNETISEELFDNLYLNKMELIEGLTNIIFKFDFALNQIDSLTKSWKREFFLGLLENEFLKMKRGEKPFCLVYFDIDFFKTINDSYSHYIGDIILRELIKLMKNSLREYDSISRWGGDEFLILLPKTNLNEAILIINRVKEQINKNIFKIQKLKLKLTCSFGIVEGNLNTTINELINKADTLLYKAKELGRDRIEV